jgi:hypothetical protein
LIIILCKFFKRGTSKGFSFLFLQKEDFIDK